MPVVTRTAIDGWSSNETSQSTDQSPSGSMAQGVDESPRTNSSRTPTLIGESPVMKKLFSVIERVAPTDASVLITGATGTGKELAARAIHDLSSRRDGAFVDINCSAIPETLIEAELFGHQRGTFTGAHENRSGLFEKASGGTLFLDEVDALNLSAQAKLLRVLQERTVRRIGARANIAIDVRIISATNCDLAQAVAEGRFRPDLYYRLRVLPLQLPELCTRGDDVDLLVDHFLPLKAARMGQEPRNFTPQAKRALRDYPWPGNVRELENAVEYALAIGMDQELGIADLPIEIANHVPSDLHDFRSVLQAYMNDTVPLAEIEKRYILTVLQQFGGNQVRAAAALGIDRSKLYRRLRQYGVKAVKFFQEEEEHGFQFRGAKVHDTGH
jgi:DNA-binding NtrC family response regulator